MTAPARKQAAREAEKPLLAPETRSGIRESEPREDDQGASPALGEGARFAHPVDAEERIARAPERGNGSCRPPWTNRNDDVLVPEPTGTAAVTEFAEVVAARVVELLEQRDRRRATGLVTAAEVAERLGVRKSWVYTNQQRLGAIRLGDGPKARLRFDLEQATRAINRERRQGPRAPRQRGLPRKTCALPPGVELLRGRRANDEG
jgi:hypothetical protein